jgi:hypothetical protein
MRRRDRFSISSIQLARATIGHGIRAQRPKSGAISFDLLEVEGSTLIYGHVVSALAHAPISTDVNSLWRLLPKILSDPEFDHAVLLSITENSPLCRH